MKVLILTVTAGHGHNQAATVIADYLKSRDIACEVLDTYEYINPILSESVAKGYLISTKFTPAVYGKLYHLAEKREKNNKKLSVTTLINANQNSVSPNALTAIIFIVYSNPRKMSSQSQAGVVGNQNCMYLPIAVSSAMAIIIQPIQYVHPITNPARGPKYDLIKPINVV